MAWKLPTAGKLLDRVRFEREGDGENDGGVIRTAWTPVGGDADRATRSAKLEPTRGGEATVSGRIQGSAVYDLWVIFDSLTSTISAGDRVVNARSGDIYAIGWVDDPDRRRRWLLLQVTSAGRNS